MILVALFCVAATRKMSLNRPKGAQNILEILWEFIRGLVNENMDPRKGAAFLSIVVTYFIFILFSNVHSLLLPPSLQLITKSESTGMRNPNCSVMPGL
jgi:F-type H+-transporting ATPase subunit a